MDSRDTRDLMVTIRCLVYNHEPYLRQCLDGFVMQKTNFRFEAIVHDDASTDGSADIIREYAAKYPDIIKPIIQTENQYSKRDGSITRILNAYTHGKYVAYCEGDDYWTDPLKLQKQVDFLESHPDYVMCSHRFKVFKQNENLMEDDWYGEVPDGITYDLNSLIHGSWYNQPLTLVYRFEALNVNEYLKYPNAKDATLVYHLLKNGKGYLMPDVMGVYRLHSGGVWAGASIGSRICGEFKTRAGICEVEQSYESAFFLRELFNGWIPRSWMLREWRLMVKSFRMISSYFGRVSTIKMYVLKILLNKNLKE